MYCTISPVGFRGQQSDKAAGLDQEPSEEVRSLLLADSQHLCGCCFEKWPQGFLLDNHLLCMQVTNLIKISNLLPLYSEFDETDPDKVKEAVRIFVHSCAGYSVATYVLVSS